MGKEPIFVHVRTAGRDVYAEETLMFYRFPGNSEIWKCSDFAHFLDTSQKWTETNKNKYIVVMEFLLHGTGWISKSYGEIVLQENPSLSFYSNVKVTTNDLVLLQKRGYNSLVKLQKPFQRISHFLLSGCNIGADNPGYADFRLQLCRLLFGIVKEPGFPTSVEIRSCSSYTDSDRRPTRAVPEGYSASTPSTHPSKIVIERFYRNEGQMLRTRDKSLVTLLGSFRQWVP